MHITAIKDKRAVNLAKEAGIEMFGKPCPYHAQIQADAKAQVEAGRGEAIYVGTTSGVTAWLYRNEWKTPQ